MKTRLAIFASGSGTNALNIIRYFKDHRFIDVCLVCSNKKDSPVIEKSKKLFVSTFVFSKNELANGSVISFLKKKHISWIILAGFNCKIPQNILSFFANKILNIHPSLLPKYGGKGMYGLAVHEAVIKNNDLFSGISIHFVNKEYDKGKVVFQKKVSIKRFNNASSLQKRIKLLEHSYYPKIINKIICP